MKYISKEDFLKIKVLGRIPKGIVTAAAKKMLADLKKKDVTLYDEEYGKEFDDLEWMKTLVKILVEDEDHSIKFVVGSWYPQSMKWYAVYLDQARNEEYPSRKLLEPLCIGEWEEYRAYFRERGYDCTEHIFCDELNNLILDFYGIEKHAPRKLSKKEALAQVENIDEKIQGLKNKIQKLKRRRKHCESFLFPETK